MRDHLVLVVNRMLTESNLQSTIESKNRIHQSTTSMNADDMISSLNIDVNSVLLSSKFVECRICHDEEEESNMETPCSCRGSLKYAHRKCVQKWCNEKGNTICEICHQQFKPGYTEPPPVFYYGGIDASMPFRGHWEMSRVNLHSQYTTARMPDHEYLDSDFDEFQTHSPRSLLCCRIVAITFTVLLVFRHTLPIIISGAGEYSLTLLMLLILRIVGIFLPIYIMFRAFTYIQRRRRYRDPHFHIETSEDENDSNHLPPRFIHPR